MANITTTYRDFFKVHDCDPVCPRKEDPSAIAEDDDPDARCKVKQEHEEEAGDGDDVDCCSEEEECVQELEPCPCRQLGRAKCECVEAVRLAKAHDFMWPRRQPLTYYAKVFEEYPFMLKMYGEHHSVGIEVEPEDLQSVYMHDYGADKKPVPLERKADPPRPARVVSPFLYRNPPFQWNASVEQQIPWKPSDCPLTVDQLLLCQRRPKGCQSCGCYTSLKDLEGSGLQLIKAWDPILTSLRIKEKTMKQKRPIRTPADLRPNLVEGGEGTDVDTVSASAT